MNSIAYFFSDTHLGASYIDDHRAHEARVVEFLDSIKDDAAELYLLGDIIDYWFEYRHVVPRGYVRFFGKLAELADSGVKITWVVGNHDVWLRDYLSSEVGLKVFYGTTEVDVLGHRFLISHGDDVGKRPFGQRLTRFLFHNKVTQWLYSLIHPNFTWWIACGLSTSNRVNRNPQTEQRSAKHCIELLDEFARDYATKHPEVEHFVMGHLHSARLTPIDDRRSICHLGAWIYDYWSYARFDGQQLTLHNHRKQ